MLVTDVGGLREIVSDGKCGYVVKPEAQCIAEAILDFFENKRRSQFSDGVKAEKRNYSWDKMTTAITEVYKLCSPTPSS
jgi:glycosyltransferase involved in cell wall biosynthesis